MKQWLLKNNLSSGELSPLLWTRTDIQQYANGARKLLNVIPLVEGGVKKRPGTRFRLKIGNGVRLIPFISNSENAFLLIFTATNENEGLLQVYNPRTRNVEFMTPTPYGITAIKELQYAHTRYRMFIVQGDNPVHRLICSEDFSTWSFAEFTFSIYPNDDFGTTPNVALKPSGVDVGKTISLTASAFPTWNSNESYLAGDRVIYLELTYRALMDNKGSTPTTENTKWEVVTAVDADVFNTGHIGSIVSINGGQVKITSLETASKIFGEILVKLNSDVEAIAKSWSIKTAAFGPITGYPRSVCFFKQRLIFANTKTSPNKMWFSAIKSDGDFLETTEDADSFSIASSSAQSDNILHLAQRGGVVALTGGSEFLISSTGPLTPSSAQIDQHTSYGAQAHVRPCMVGNELLFVQRGGERLRALSYRYEVDGLVSPELSAIAPHIAAQHGGLKELTYQQTPYSIVWMVMNDGKVASITLNRDQEMNAWSQHDFGGEVISMCALPTLNGSDQCFMLVVRNGQVTLEELHDDAMSDGEVLLNAANSYTHTQLPNLPGRIYNWNTVEDGYYYSNTQPDHEFVPEFYAGLPFELEVQLLAPDYSQVPSTTMFHKIAVHRVVLWLKDSVGGFVDGRELKHKKNNQDAFRNLPFTGYVEEGLTGWVPLHEFNLKITHNKPLPFHVQSVSMMVSINGE